MAKIEFEACGEPRIISFFAFPPPQVSGAKIITDIRVKLNAS